MSDGRLRNNTRPEKYYTRGYQIRSMYRQAFVSVMDAYHTLSSTNGSGGAMDYESCMEGKPKYKNDISFLRTIDFVADVEKTLKKVLSVGEFDYINRNYVKTDEFPVVLSEWDLATQEKAGQFFQARGLYPLKSYFTVVKGKGL